MKKLNLSIMALAFCGSLFMQTPVLANDINVTYNGTIMRFDQPPVIENERVLVPMRKIFETIGAEVIWDEPTQSITAKKDTTTILITLNSNSLTVNNETKQLDAPAALINETTMVPVRAIAESFNINVLWDEPTQTVQIVSSPVVTDGNLTKVSLDSKIETKSPLYTNRWATVSNHYVFEEDDTYSVLVAASNVVTIKTYNSVTNEFISENSIHYELEIFGGFYAGDDNYFMVFGQKNSEELPDAEVFRLVKYDKNFNKISRLSITGKECQTTIPFNAGTLAMTENDDELIIHTARTRYKSEDGLNHQSQVTFIVDTENMKLKEDVSLFQGNHVSHSFNQFAQYNDDKHVLVDHGDAYPRAIALNEYDSGGYTETNLFEIPGTIGANSTGVQIGGFLVSDNNYLVSISSVDHSKVSSYTSFTLDGLDVDERDVIVLVCNKETKAINEVLIKGYVDTGNTASAPYLVELDNDRYAVLWNERLATSTTSTPALRYVLIDGNGNKLSTTTLVEGAYLSNVAPIEVEGDVVWFTDDTLYRLKI